MATSLVAGELYIIGETDPVTGADTGFYKIGLVRETEGRFSSHRLREHQTGNPRQLVLLHTVATQIVEAVETTLHGLFATQRISGEWFILTADQRAEVLAVAERLAVQAQNGVSDLRTAARLAGEESVGGYLLASKAVLNAHRRGQFLRREANRVAKLARSLKVQLERSIRNDGGENRFGCITVRKDTNSFDERAFREAHADLWEYYQKDSCRVVPYFRWQNLESESGQSCVLDTLEVEASVPLGSPLTDRVLDEIHDLYLRLLSHEASVAWELALVEASIKAACGNAEGIEGVCTWRRTMTLKRKLDTSALKTDSPELHQQFTVTKPGATALNIVRDRNFRW